jgi:hypothetical protein
VVRGPAEHCDTALTCTYGLGRRGLETLTPCVMSTRRSVRFAAVRIGVLNRPSQSTPLLLTGADEGLTVDPDDAYAPEDRDTECMVTKVLHPVRSECPRRVREVALTVRTFEERPSR